MTGKVEGKIFFGDFLARLTAKLINKIDCTSHTNTTVNHNDKTKRLLTRLQMQVHIYLTEHINHEQDSILLGPLWTISQVINSRNKFQ